MGVVVNRPMRRLLVALALAAFGLRTPAAQTTEQPHPPVVRYSRDLSQPRGTILAATADAGGNIYVTGYTSGGLQTRSDVFQPNLRGGTYDAFVAKLDPLGNLSWATYLGGSAGTQVSGRLVVAAEMGTDIDVDSAGNVYVVGRTPSRDFPAVAPFQSAAPTSQTGFIVKLDPAGQHAAYSSYVGGSTGSASALRVAVTSLGEAYVVGQSAASDVGASRDIGAASGPSQARSFVAYIGPTGQLRDSVTFGGTCSDTIRGAAVDGQGALHVIGITCSRDFPLVAPLQATCTGQFSSCQTSFVMRFAPGLRLLTYSTFLGERGSSSPDGAFVTGASAVAIDGQGRAVVAGSTRSEWPAVRPLQRPAGGMDGFITRFTPSGGIDFSTTVGGVDDDQVDFVRVDVSGAIVLGGRSASIDFPLRSHLFEHPDVGVIRSENGGIGWERFDGLAAGANFLLRAIDPIDPRRMYATWNESPDSFSTRRVFARTDDSGRTWHRLTEPAPSPFRSFAVSPARSLFYVNDVDSFAETIRRSDDGATSWITLDTGTCCGVGSRDFRGFAFTRADPNRVYVGTTFEGVRVSTDRGATWSARSSGIPHDVTSLGLPRSIEGLAASPTTVGTLWASISPGSIYKTVDDALTWVQVYSDPEENSPTLAAGADGVTVYAGTNSGVAVSTDGGTTWRRSPVAQPLVGRVIRGVLADPQRASTVYSFTASDIWKSTDSGQSWTDITPRQFARGGIGGLMIPSAAPDTVIATGPVSAAGFLVRLTATDAPQIETSTFLGSYTGITTIALDGDAVLFTPVFPGFRLTRIGKWYSPLCGRGSLLAGVLLPQADVCAP